MKLFEKDRANIIFLCRCVLNAQLFIDDFYLEWQKFEKYKDDMFLKVVYDDLEDGIEHTPGSFFSRNVLFSEWEKSYSYSLIVLDLSLLERYDDTDIMYKLRSCVD